MDQMKAICRLELTQRAKKEIGRWALDEREFFAIQDYYDIYIEKLPVKQEQSAFSLYFDNETNGPLSKLLNERVGVLECIYKNEGFLAISFRVKGRKEPVKTNRRLPVRMKFQIGAAGRPIPLELYTKMRELPVAEERSAYVEKRIKSWEGYLRIEEKNADIEDITARFSNMTVSDDFSRATFTCGGLEAKDWNVLTGFSVKLKGSQEDLGQVADVKRSQRKVVVELSRRQQANARKGALLQKKADELVFSNFAALSQVRRLRKGFKDLQDGYAANPNLEKVLFEERPVVQIKNKKIDLDFHHPLNEFQQEAVTGAMSASDLYVIQGPPGTGKTTVISELCHQLAHAGMRTLVASQSNLAVDNALSRLLADPGIRILRYGRTESIEEEGKRFIEENVAGYWRDETLTAVNEELAAKEAAGEALLHELEALEKRKTDIQAGLPLLEEKIERKKAARGERKVVSEELSSVQRQLKELTERMKGLEAEQADLHAAARRHLGSAEQLEADISASTLSAAEHAEKEEAERKLAELQNSIAFFQVTEAIQAGQAIKGKLERELADVAAAKRFFPSLLEKIGLADHLRALLDVLAAHSYELPLDLKLDCNDLHKMTTAIRSESYSYEFQEWKSIHERLGTAIGYLRKLLEEHNVPADGITPKESDAYKTPDEMHDMVDQIAKFIKLKAKSIKIAQSAERERLLARIADNIAYLLGKVEEVKRAASRIKGEAARSAEMKFHSVKKDITRDVNAAFRKLADREQELEAELASHQQQLRKMEEERDQLAGLIDPELEEGDAVREAEVQEQAIAAFREREVRAAKAAEDLATTTRLAAEAEDRLKELDAQLAECRESHDSYAGRAAKQEEQLRELDMIISENPEQLLAEARQELSGMAARKQEIEGRQIRHQLEKELQTEWSGLLEGAGEHDLDEIRKMYVRHANVIGTTCVASARKEFMEDYPQFDVVIIDEVSKATPPELLLPMLKGKKIILVGDHHQLPPLVGRETMEEFIEEIKDAGEKEELRSMLKESLFERLFRTLPKQNKTMLAIQYRMHEKIMSTIAPFYTEGQYRLTCGLSDSDAMRDHQLESHLIGRSDHLLWLDLPNSREHFEAQVKGGTSLYNESELRKVRELLLDLDKAAEEAKSAGRLPHDQKKSVGVISFYGEQVKRIDRLIEQEIMPQHLHCRTGSVDKFQGMEMDIIILSFVRNHDQPSGTIGFAEDYRRLNVALSRARELLIIVGSADMFTKRPKKQAVRDMYARLADQVKGLGGFKTPLLLNG